MINKASTEREIAPAITGNYGKQPDNSDTSAGPMLIAEHRTSNAERRTSNGDVMTLAIRGRGDDCNLEVREDGTANAILTPNGGRGGIGCGAVAIPIQEIGKRQSGNSMNGVGHGQDGDPMFTLQGSAVHGVAIAFDEVQITSKVNRTKAEPGLPASTISKDSSMMVAHSLKAEGFDASEDGTGRGVPLVPEVCSTVSSKWAKSSGGPSGDECQNLVAEKNGGGHRPPLQPIAFSSKDHGADASENLSPTLRAQGAVESHENGGVPPAIAFPARMSGTQRARSENVSPAIGSANPTAVGTTMAVRRLTPRECERLQGFPDDFTLVEFNGKPACDGPRYKAIGNSMAVPNIEWIGMRMDLVDQLVPVNELTSE